MKEEKAIQLDLAEVEEMMTMTIRTSKDPPTPKQIRVFKMDKPAEEPTIICEYNTYPRTAL
jgi:hypothetical protein